MKNLVIALFVLTATLTACEPKISATDYNNTIVGEQGKIVNKMLDMTAKINNNQFKAALDELDGAIAQCDSSIATVTKLGAFEDDSKFHDAALDLFKFYKKILSNEYRKMLEILNKEDISMEDVAEIDNLTKNIEGEEAKYDNAMQNAQEEFAKKHDVKITDNSLQEKIDKMGE